jgi:HD-like signal output (HDOD) protein
LIYKRFEELRQSGALPTPSGVGLVILRRTQNENCSLEELTQCIQVDPAMSGRIIKLANATALAGSAPVTTVGMATRQLGIRAVRGVALGFTLVPSTGTGACSSFDYDRYWSYSLAMAIAARVRSCRGSACSRSRPSIRSRTRVCSMPRGRSRKVT